MSTITAKIPMVVTEEQQFTLPAYFRQDSFFIAVFSDEAYQINDRGIFVTDQDSAIHRLEDTMFFTKPFRPISEEEFSAEFLSITNRMHEAFCHSIYKEEANNESDND